MLTRPPKQPSPPSTQSGFTIIECLLAIIIVSILLAAIAPVIVLSVATRVQARRVELGAQAARTYIDGVRAGTIELPAHAKLLTDIKEERIGFARIPAPPSGALINCLTTSPNYPYCRNNKNLSLYCIDVDGSGCTGPRDMVVQSFRSVQNLTDDNGSKGYLLGVRVYRADAFDGGSALQTTWTLYRDKEPTKVATYAGGKGNQKAPLAEITTEIRGKKMDYKSLCDRLPGTCPSR
jgi:prepilin-type N-terminal cleavage/methylation domain-containing protein